MYGGSGKLGRGGGGSRGGGGGSVKRNVNSTFPPPPHRSSTATGGRFSIGGAGAAGPRNRSTTPATTSSAPSAGEETFSLVTGNPLNFAMIIRLVPELVDEIKRVEADGGTVRIKFDANANNQIGNVIDVGGKDFRFTSLEMGDLCDIYEERRRGDDGNGLLVESGGAWRKLNVQRILDESTKNHVKMRSEEAERKLKSRKAIILDPGNPSMKSQMKALAAAEVNPRRMPFKQKEPPFKKRKAEPPPGGPHKSVYKSGLSSTTPSKSRPSASPLRSPLEQSGASASPFGTGSLTKGYTSVEDVMPTQAMSRENATGFEKEMPSTVITAAERDKPGRKGNLGAKPTDLRSLLISLLIENPKGMSLKALEKAIGDTIPNSARQIEPIIKKIATLKTPGRYFLKPGVELESLKKPSFGSGSSPEDNHHQTPATIDNCDQIHAPKPIFSVKAPIKELEEQTQLDSKPGEEFNCLEKIDIPNHSPDLFGEKKVSENSEGPAGSSSNSGSDSDSESESSDSGSDSGSRSKSISPAGSGSGSSSDSESDASSNSKEGSDEDVDIMTSDDDKESKHKLQAFEHGLSTLPFPWRTPDGGPVHSGIEKQDCHGSGVVEIEKDLPDHEQEAEIAVVTISVPTEGEKPAEEIKPSSPDRPDHQERQVYTGNLYNERENMATDGFKLEQSESYERISKVKSKRGYDGKLFDDNPEGSKRFKGGNLTQPPMSGSRSSLFSESAHNFSPNRPIEGPTIQTPNRMVKEGTEFSLQKDYNEADPGKSISSSQQPGRKSVDVSAQAKAPVAVDRPGKYADSLGCSVKHSERTLQTHGGFSMQKDKVNRETQDADGCTNEKKPPKNSKEGAVGYKHSTPVDSYYRKHDELVGKFKEAGSVTNSQMGYSPKDNNRTDSDRFPLINGRGSILRRELSDLELGELREPLPDETPGIKKQFERKSSFKQSENKPTASDYWDSDLSKGKPAGKTSADSVKPSPPHSNIGIPSNPEGLSKKRTPEHHVEDITKPHHGGLQPQPQHLLRVDHAEVGSQFNKLVDAISRSRYNEAEASQGIDMQGYGNTNRKVSLTAPQQHDAKRVLVPHSTKESRRQKANTLTDLSDGRKDTSLTESNDGGQKRRESSSDDNSSCSYSKYEKEEPELKEPIKDLSQYKEYVQEYREKFDCYFSINKILESDRNEFRKLGRDLDLAKGGNDMDRYYSILGELHESYRRCGTRHKRLKKIFIVLHGELKHLKQMIKDYAVSCSED